VSGSVARSGNTMRINVRLIDAANGQQLYSQVLEERWTELFALQDKLADRVAFFLRRRLGDAIALRDHRAATTSYAAWEAVQLASDLTRRAMEGGILRADTTAPSLLRSADSLYQRAAALDPEWILPTFKRGRLALAQRIHASLAPPGTDSTSFARMPRVQRRVAWARRAIELADQALRQNAGSPDALALRGEALFLLVEDGAGGSDSLTTLAERDLRKALEARPYFAAAWGTLAQLFRQSGRFADAAAAAQRAFDSDSYFEERSIVAIGFWASLHAGQIEDARRWCRTGLEHYRGDPRFAECELTLLGWTARSPASAAAAWRLVDQIERRDTLHMLAQSWAYRRLMIAAILARADMGDSARAVFATIERLQSPYPGARGSYMTEAYVRLLLGDRDTALARLRDHLKDNPQARALVAKHPWFRDLNGDSRFQALTRPVH
jgi:tetratricopeptide (TPR) repeat protein